MFLHSSAAAVNSQIISIRQHMDQQQFWCFALNLFAEFCYILYTRNNMIVSGMVVGEAELED